MTNRHFKQVIRLLGHKFHKLNNIQVLPLIPWVICISNNSHKICNNNNTNSSCIRCNSIKFQLIRCLWWEICRISISQTITHRVPNITIQWFNRCVTTPFNLIPLSMEYRLTSQPPFLLDSYPRFNKSQQGILIYCWDLMNGSGMTMSSMRSLKVTRN